MLLFLLHVLAGAGESSNHIVADALNVLADASESSNRIIAYAALITAVGGIILGIYKTNVDRRVAEENRITAEDARKGLQTQIDHTTTTATLAGSVAVAAVKASEQKAIDGGVVEDFRNTIAVLTEQMVSMSTATSEQLSRSTAALVGCEEREARLMAEMGGLREDMARMDNDLRLLRQIVAQTHPELMLPPDPREQDPPRSGDKA